MHVKELDVNVAVEYDVYFVVESVG